MFHSTKTFFAIMTSAFVSALTLTSCDKKPQEADIVVLYTTDVHGACLQYDFKHNEPARTSLANVFTYVKEQREEHPDGTILLDTGDFLQGQPSVYYYNYVDTTDQHVVAQVYNYMQYDALGCGNHDIETGEDVYYRRLPKQFNMPWLCANAIDQRTGEPMFQPYAVFNRQGLKIAVLGLITPNIHSWLPKSLWPNLEFEDMAESAQKWVPIIKEKENPDIIIGLFHAGSDYTINGSNLDTHCNENGSVPAAIKAPGLDLVLVGHDHMQKAFDVVNVAGDTVKIIDAATQSRLIGRAEIHLKLQADGTYKKEIKTDLIDSKDYAPDSAFCQKFQPIIDQVNDYVKAPIGEITADVPGINGLYGPCAFMDLIHDAQLWATKADISVASVLSPYDTIKQGPIAMRELFTIYKYENQLFTMKMTGADVKKYLEHGFGLQFAQVKGKNQALLARKDDMHMLTATFNYTSAAGIKYTVDITKPANERVTILSMSDGTPFDLNKEYKVAVNSYQASGGGDFFPVGLGWNEQEVAAHTINAAPVDVRQYIAQYIKENSPITPHLRGDWEVIPKDLWESDKAWEINHVNSRIR